MTGIIPLKQSTAFTWKAGPFVDDTDGKTAETALSIAQADIRLTKNGGDYAQSHNSAGATHDEYGCYDIPLDTTDTNTLGHLRVTIQKSGALPVWQDFWVKPANVFDADQGTDLLDVNVSQISEDTDAANNLEAACDGNTYNVGGGAVVAASVTTKTGYELTAAYDAAKTAAQVNDIPTADITAIKTVVESATFGLSALKTLIDTITAKSDLIPADMATALAHLNADIDSRMATFSYTAPANADITAIKVITDHLAAMLEDGDGAKRYTASALENVPSGEATVSREDIDAIADAVLDEQAAGHIGVIAENLDVKVSEIGVVTPAQIREELDANSKLKNVTMPGWGLIHWPYLLTEPPEGTGTPIPDARVWVCSDAAGANIIASGVTGTDGRAWFWLDAGTVYVFRRKSGYNFTNPDTEVVA